MRILFVSGLTGFASGGVNTEMCRLIAGMRDKGHEVGLAIDRLPDPLDTVRHFKIHYPPNDDFADHILSAVREFKADSVHLIGGGLSALQPMNAMALPAGRLRVPWIFTAHNLPPFEQISGFFLGHNRLHYLMRNTRALPATLLWKRFLKNGSFQKVIAHSQTVRQHLLEYGCPAAKIVVIPFGCDAPDSAAAGDAAGPFEAAAFPKILTIAGYAHHKGIHDYILVISRLLKTYPRLAYIVIGNSRNKQYTAFLQRLIDRLGLTANVTLLRNATDEQKHAALRQCDLYVQPSHEEGFCLAFSEAAMVSPRMLGCATGEIAGLAGNEPGTKVVPSKSVDMLFGASLELLNTAVAPRQLEDRRQGLEARYSWPHYLEQHEAALGSPKTSP